MSEELCHWRWLPELRFINRYAPEPAYLQVLADSIRQFQAVQGTPERLLFSFHGIPRDYYEAGDPYPDECRETAEQTARLLGLEPDQWGLSFQSRFGRQEWVQPYTDATLEAWGGAGIKRVQVVCPAFSADCLETLEEIAVENRDHFLAAGGQEYRYIPALNDQPAHVEMLSGLILRHLQGW